MFLVVVVGGGGGVCVGGGGGGIVCVCLCGCFTELSGSNPSYFLQLILVKCCKLAVFISSYDTLKTGVVSSLSLMKLLI